MNPNELESATIDSFIKTVNQLYSIIQLQDADEGVKEEHIQEHMMPTSKSIDGEIRVERSLDPPMMQPNSGLNRTKSAPPLNLPDSVNLIRKLQGALRRLKRNLKHMESLQSEVETELTIQLNSLNEVVEGVKPSDMSSTNNDLEDITKKLLDLVSKVTVSPEKQKSKKASPYYLDGDGSKNRRPIVCLPGIHANEEDLKRLAVFRYVQGELDKVSDQQRMCLLSFAVFPENKEVNRTMLMYWWIGEGILSSQHIPSEKGILKPEDVVKDILDGFTEKNLIQPVENKRKMEPSSYKMAPFVHASVVLISKEIGLFDMYDEKEKPTMKHSRLNKVCLVEGSSSQPEAKAKKMDSPHLIETVFNVSERFPEFTRRWFTQAKKLRVLYLGRWERTEREIEMDSRRVMKDLGSLTSLRFLSFQGILTIRSLSRSALKLRELIILDLRDCYNLETLPDDIHQLKSLVYLDLTGCEALESIPMQLSWLDNLEVLKGFVLGDVDTSIKCKLRDLVHLRKLQNLSVVVHQQDYGLHELGVDINDFEKLEKLKVRWGSIVSGFSQIKMKPVKDGIVSIIEPPKLFSLLERTTYVRGHKKREPRVPGNLKKLNLQRFPNSELPRFLQPHNLQHLEKLHLGSSRLLKSFGPLPPNLYTFPELMVVPHVKSEAYVCAGAASEESSMSNTPFLLQRWEGSIKLFNFIGHFCESRYREDT
ncbi:hypothetical protein ARALYDRAFT_356470 [Arabidopsis lyrata subsp. lyrata]|uniref:Disease resistance R13L4/SHOC-2-like LRR domain-containing protein n=1 Tax=Arabidopsis lyrata subsp. lyrata TaxID=81972 RepID=D7MU25_ARALL|nr:hypothetical protein ARALYDRAFT_356470 [Arabidopsis lyrata subsp. lyrata]